MATILRPNNLWHVLTEHSSIIDLFFWRIWRKSFKIYSISEFIIKWSCRVYQIYLAYAILSFKKDTWHMFVTEKDNKLSPLPGLLLMSLKDCSILIDFWGVFYIHNFSLNFLSIVYLNCRLCGSASHRPPGPAVVPVCRLGPLRSNHRDRAAAGTGQRQLVSL